jgi:hypothetical protein
VLGGHAHLAAGDEIAVENSGLIVKRGVDNFPVAGSSIQIRMEDDARQETLRHGCFQTPTNRLRWVNFPKADPEFEIDPADARWI